MASITIEQFYKYKNNPDNRVLLTGLDKYIDRGPKRKLQHNKHNNQSSWLMNNKANLSEDDKLVLQITSILNKLSSNNIEQLAEEIINLNINTEDIMVRLVNTIFNKAISEEKFCSLYAELTKYLSFYYIEIDEKKIYFRELMINKCQNMFSDAISLPQELEIENNSKFANKKQVLGSIAYIGELYNHGLLTDKIIFTCFKLIFMKINLKKAYIIDIMCLLIKSVREKFSKKCHTDYDTCINHIKSLQTDSRISQKDKFAIMDILEE